MMEPKWSFSESCIYPFVHLRRFLCFALVILALFLFHFVGLAKDLAYLSKEVILRFTGALSFVACISFISVLS